MSNVTKTMALSERNRRARQRFIEVVAGCDAATLATTVPACPKWTVSDLFSHLAYGAQALATGNFPGDDFEAWTRAQVDAGAGKSVDEVAAVWGEYGPQMDAALDATPQVFMTLMDVTVHEMDLRSALGMSAVGDQEHMAFFLATVLERLPMITGGRDLPAVTISTDDGGSVALGSGGPGASVTVPGFELCRGVFGRRSDAQVRAWDWDGDPTPFLGGAITIFTPRDTDLVERP